MEFGHLKTQIMTMFMMKGDKQDIFHIIYSMVFMSVLEYTFKYIPEISKFLKTNVFQYLSKKQNQLIPMVKYNSNNEKIEINSIVMTRVFEDEGTTISVESNNIFVEKVDAIIDYICSIDSTKHIKINKRYMVNTEEEIDLTPLLKAKIKETIDGASTIIEIKMYSTVLKINEIKKWIDEIYNNYIFEKNNKLGNRIFYFNEIPFNAVKMEHVGNKSESTEKKATYRWDNMPKTLNFNMTEFNTSKSFDNIYGNHVNELKERLDLFINHPDWYMNRGIPHSLGILLHGVPGAGKTSTIKAIAKDTHRHIFNLSLREFTTQQQLTNLFYNETVNSPAQDGLKHNLKIPLNRRVYVIEDIDCLNDVVLDRALKLKTSDTDGDALTLSFLLNLLDGVLETPGRILVITSNYPDRLDRALIRPGRIDVSIEFKNASCSFVLDMINKFYNKSYTIDDIPLELNDIFTPAEVMESLCTYFKNSDKAIEHLVKKIKIKKEKQIQFQANLQSTPLVFINNVDNEVELELELENIILDKKLIVNNIEIIESGRRQKQKSPPHFVRTEEDTIRITRELESLKTSNLFENTTLSDELKNNNMSSLYTLNDIADDNSSFETMFSPFLLKD